MRNIVFPLLAFAAGFCSIGRAQSGLQITLSVNPTTIQVSSNSALLTIYGQDIDAAVQLNWNETFANGTTTNATLTLVQGNLAGLAYVVVPSSLLMAPGTVSLQVPALLPGFISSNVVTLTVAAAPTVSPALAINSLDPGSAIAGSGQLLLKILGTGFLSGAVVQWNNGSSTVNLATAFTSSSELDAVIPAASLATQGAAVVTVLNSGGAVSNGKIFSIGSAAAPILGSLSPSSAVAAGQSVQLTVTGSNFISGQNGSVVQWYGGATPTPLTTQFIDPTHLVATVPASLLSPAGTIYVAVLNTGGQLSNALPFTIQPGPSEVVGSISPMTATVGQAGFMLTVNGANFSSAAVVQWNENGTVQQLSTSFISSTQLTATVPATLLTSAGTVLVNVLDAGVATNVNVFTVQTVSASSISLINVAPNQVQVSSSATQITLNGMGFVTASVVQWNSGSAVTPLTTRFISAGQLMATIPANLISVAGVALITVSNPGGVSSNGTTVTVQSPTAIIPTVTGLSSSAATAGSATFQITIDGSDFIASPGGSTVLWNNGTQSTSLTTNYVNATELTAIVPASLIALPGNAFISVQNPGGGTTNSNLFTVLPATAPVIGMLDTQSTTFGGPLFQLNVNGSNFVAGSTVEWNSGTGPQPLTTFVSSPNQLSALVPANLITAIATILVTVQNPGGAISNAEPFMVQGVSGSGPTISSLGSQGTTAGSVGTTLAIMGSNFTTSSSVQWNAGNGNQLLNSGFVNAGQLTALVPTSFLATPGVALVSVVNPGNLVSNTETYSINPPSSPFISSLGTIGATAGGPAFQIMVTGTAFAAGSIVQWTASATPVDLVTGFSSSNVLNALIPANLIAASGAALITVLNPGGAASNAITFTISSGSASTPALTKLTPNVVNAGTPAFTLAAAGTNFVAGSILQWNPGSGNQPLSTGVTVDPMTNVSSLTAIVPASLISSAGVALVSVLNPGGAISPSIVFTVQPVSGTAPSINPTSGLQPASEQAGSPSFQLTVNGSNFTSGSLVIWNGGSAPVTLSTGFTSGTMLTALVPASLITTQGIALISVQNPGGATSNSETFTIGSNSLPIPAISALGPSSLAAAGVSFQLAITGTGFTPSSTVQWNAGAGAQTLSTGYVSATQLTAIVPSNLIAAPGVAFVTVVNVGGLISNSLTFTVTSAQGNAPVINMSGGILPASAASGSTGFQIIVNGSNFLAGSIVTWNAGAGPQNLTTGIVQGGSQLTALVPASLVTIPGTAFITVVNPGNIGSNAVTFTVTGSAQPTLSALTPPSVSANGPAFVLTVTGTNFVSNATVLWNNTALSTTFVSATSLTAQVPANLVAAAGVANVTVQNPGGATSQALSFSIAAPNAPTVTGLTPASGIAGGSAFQLSITGTGFTTAAVAAWNGVTLPTSFVSATQVSALVSASLIATAGSANVAVQDPGSPFSPIVTFLINGPSIGAITPATVLAGAQGFNLVVTGSNFLPGSTVLWNGAALPTSFNSATQLTAPVPASLVATSGTASITAQNPGGAVSPASVFTIGPFTLTIITSALPDAAVNQAYSQNLVATGGSPPYVWTISSGALPGGLVLSNPNSSITLITGTPTTPGTTQVNLTVTDSALRTVSKSLSLSVIMPLTITSTSPLPNSLMGVSFSQILLASGGTPPYLWSVVGALPPGLTLNQNTGQISGTPTTAATYQFNIGLADSHQLTVNQPFSLTILPASPTISLTGIVEPLTPGQQPPLNLALASAYPSDLTGTLTLAFAPDTIDDPAIKFSSGGRTVAFTIPTGATNAVFPGSPNFSLATGTVSGTFTFAVTLQSGGATVTPSPAPSFVYHVLKQAPVITSAYLVATGSGNSSGVNVVITGFSNTRDMKQGTFSFAPSQGSSLQTTQLVVPLQTLFSSWYQSSASTALGSTFFATIPFSITNSSSVLASVTIILTNSAGDSVGFPATFQTP